MRKIIQRVLTAAAVIAFISIIGVAGIADTDPTFTISQITTQIAIRLLIGAACFCFSRGLDNPYQDETEGANAH